MNTEQKILVNFRVDEEVWKEFKKVSSSRHSDSSKELRKMIDTYIEYSDDYYNFMKNIKKK